MKNWKMIRSEQIYDNPWISLEHHEVMTPNGTQGIYGKVLFKNLAIGIIPLDQNFNTWIVGQYRYTLDQYSWEIPMGGGPILDKPLLSAQRELQEETGLTAERWDHIMTVHTSNCVTDEVGHIYLARGLTQGSTNFDITEDLQIKKLPLAEVYQMVMDGIITDSISIAGILKLDVLLKTHKY